MSNQINGCPVVLFSFSSQEIDEYIVQAKERGYETMVNFGKQGLNLAATAAVTAAVKVNIAYYLFSIKIQCTYTKKNWITYSNSIC